MCGNDTESCESLPQRAVLEELFPIWTGLKVNHGFDKQSEKNYNRYDTKSVPGLIRERTFESEEMLWI